MTLVEGVLFLCGAITTVSGAVTVISKVYKKQIKNITKDLVTKDDLSKMKTEISQELKSHFNNDLQKLSAELTNVSNRLSEFVEKSNKADEHIKENLLDQSRYLFVKAEQFYSQKPYIDEHIWDSLRHLQKSYTTLGGNSYVDDIMKQLSRKSRVSATQFMNHEVDIYDDDE